jgi:nucleotide-binding universal stress UspA family protein
MSQLPRKILLATDGSEDAELAGLAAASLSVGSGAELHIVHAWQSVPHLLVDADSFEEEAARILKVQAERVADAGAAVRVAHLVMGPPVDAILDLGEEIGADLLVVGSRGHGTLERLILGSVSEGVVHHSTRPVLVVRGGEDAWPPERVVIGEDGSEAAKKAAEMASSVGELFGARCILVRVYPEFPETDRVGRISDPRAVDDALRQVERELHERTEELGRLAGRRPRMVIAAGDAAVAILEEAREADTAASLIAVGSRGLGLARRLRLGSVSTKVLRAAEGPVLVYPHAT